MSSGREHAHGDGVRTPQSLRALAREPEFRLAAKDMLATALGISAWGLVTGVAMVKSGMPVSMAIVMSLFVYAGSAQLAVLPLLTTGAPLWVVWLTATCVNLRFIIFSNLWRSYFVHRSLLQRLTIGYFSGDAIFVFFMQRYPEPRPAPGQLAYFWGASLLNWLAWQVPSIAGIVLANAIPLSWGLGFAGVLALLGVLLSMLVDRPAWIATLVSAAAAVAAYALPLKLNILVAIAAAVAAGLLAEAAERRLRKPAVALRAAGSSVVTGAGTSRTAAPPAQGAPAASTNAQPTERTP